MLVYVGKGEKGEKGKGKGKGKDKGEAVNMNDPKIQAAMARDTGLFGPPASLPIPAATPMGTRSTVSSGLSILARRT